MNNSKVTLAVSKTISIVQMAVGIFLLLIFGICTFTWKTKDGVGFLIFCIVCDILGIILVVFSHKRSKSIKDFKKYVAAISSDPSGSIANLAAALGTSQDIVKKNLEFMIKKKYFANAYIHQETNCIVIGKSKGLDFQNQGNQRQPNAPKVEMVPVTCQCCGGMNKIAKNSVVECDFCGSPING